MVVAALLPEDRDKREEIGMYAKPPRVCRDAPGLPGALCPAGRQARAGGLPPATGIATPTT